VTVGIVTAVKAVVGPLVANSVVKPIVVTKGVSRVGSIIGTVKGVIEFGDGKKA
jgi:hypothetical protein